LWRGGEEGAIAGCNFFMCNHWLLHVMPFGFVTFVRICSSVALDLCLYM
jgi:hypothetical protein